MCTDHKARIKLQLQWRIKDRNSSNREMKSLLLLFQLVKSHAFLDVYSYYIICVIWYRFILEFNSKFHHLHSLNSTWRTRVFLYNSRIKKWSSKKSTDISIPYALRASSLSLSSLSIWGDIFLNIFQYVEFSVICATKSINYVSNMEDAITLHFFY